MSDARPVVVTTRIVWKPVAGIEPRMCLLCGHLHRARHTASQPTLAAQWHTCDEGDTCGCQTLTLARKGSP